MANEPQEPAPLAYQPLSRRRPLTRGVVVTLVGSGIALIGIIVFLAAHAISAPPTGLRYNVEDWRLRELAWRAFGIALLLSGTLITAVGLTSWCLTDAG